MKKILLLVFIPFFFFPAIAQINEFIPQYRFNKTIKRDVVNKKEDLSGNTTEITSGIIKNIELKRHIEKGFKINSSPPKQLDTLFIGLVPNDSLIIAGNYNFEGTIIVWGDGILRFRNANATIIGNIYVWGTTAKLTIDSSYIYCPQQYFYQRSLVAAGNGSITVKNSTLDYGDLSHNLVATDSSLIEMENVQNIGFTTCGVYDKARIKINQTNQAGEYIITDKSQLEFSNANTILLWHQIPDGAVFNMDFPTPGNVTNFQLNPLTPGISGINYSIVLNNCTDVMWGLMPSKNSNVNILNSILRAVGLWFTGSDSLDVNGLVNNSTYINFTANLADRNLTLANTRVQTWSLYAFENVYIDVSGCIVGEIGMMDGSSADVENVFIDGSGGYFFVNDNSFVVCANSTTSSSVRSAGNSILIYAYSNISNGSVMSLGNSVMILLQSLLAEDPVPNDASCMWFVKLETPSTAYSDSNFPLYGSAWIDKTSVSQLMDFSYYQLFYQKDGDSLWIPITAIINQEKRHEPLAIWNTLGLAPGNYILKLEVTDNFPDSNKVEALKSITLLPAYLQTAEIASESNFNIYPNPASEYLVFSNNSGEEVLIAIIDISGKVVLETIAAKGLSSISLKDVAKGLYQIIVLSNKNYFVSKLIKY